MYYFCSYKIKIKIIIKVSMLVNYVLLHYQVTTTSLIKQSSPRRCIFQLYNKMYNNKKRKNATIILKR